ncbi:ephrin-A2-like isoform X1 [Lampetra planeri]
MGGQAAGARMGPGEPRMWWLLLAVLSQVARIAGAERFVIYWNASNSRLQKDDFLLKVNINDYLDVYCPHYGTAVATLAGSPPKERYELFMVNAEGYARCDTSGGFVRWRCDNPDAPATALRFSEKFQLFTPFSAGFEFRSGRDYFYISASADSKDKSNNNHNSSNNHKCLRLKVSVCCAPTTRTTTPTPSSPPQRKPRPRNQQDGVAEGASPAHQTGTARRGHAPRAPHRGGLLTVMASLAVPPLLLLLAS